MIAMNRIQEKAFALLKEIDQCCEQNGIDYYLCGTALLEAYRVEKLPEGAHHISVALFANDVGKFLEAMDQRKGRSLEHWGNNKNYPDFSLRYIDKESLCYHMLNHRGFNYNGIFVRIDIIRDDSHVNQVKRLIERGINLNSGNFKQRVSIKALVLKYVVKFFLLLCGKERFVKNYFNKQIAASEGQMQQFRLVSKVYPSLLLMGPKKSVKLYGNSFQTFSYTEEYLMYRFGLRWKSIELKVGNDDMIINPCITSENYEKALAGHHWNDKKFIRNRVWIKLKHSARVNRRIRAEQKKTRYIVDMIYLKGIYLPEKEKIISLHKEGKLDDLRSELDVYIELIGKRKHKLCFDLEISEIAMDLLRQDRGRLYVERLQE